ncbi:MAG: hypothetical protein MZW92_50340 [Comamonadaceae bacterium]|nr:hypothetical protein [Comamonadaceae bacterium]
MSGDALLRQLRDVVGAANVLTDDQGDAALSQGPPHRRRPGAGRRAARAACSSCGACCRPRWPPTASSSCRPPTPG